MSNKITAFKHGPLELYAEKIDFYYEGKKLDISTLTHPCRCTASKKQPWCDGSHVQAKFSDEREIKEEVLERYKGDNITINFNRSICASSKDCMKHLPEVFNFEKSEQTWISPNSADNERIIESIKLCPSGALSYSIGMNTYIDEREECVIKFSKKGALHVEGISLEGFTKPSNASSTKYTLCTCARSKNKPFCDGSHS